MVTIAYCSTVVVHYKARELTQMQTIIQKQIERFGNNIFKEGAAVKPGGLQIDTSYEFVKLDATSTSTNANVGSILTGATSGIKAEVLQRVAPLAGDPVTVYVRYVDTSAHLHLHPHLDSYQL